MQDGAIKIRVGAPAVEGKANRELESFLAGVLHLSPSRVRVVKGGRGRFKVVEVEGLPQPDLMSRLGL